MDDFRIEPASWSHAEDHARLSLVRREVFLEEQGVPEELEWDELDPASVHVIALDNAEGAVIGCGRLTPMHTIGRMAVRAPWRGRGVGAAILRSLLEAARERAVPSVSLHSQVHAVGFYRQFGFVDQGAEYLEAGIPHQSMCLALSLLDAPQRMVPVFARCAIASLEQATDWIDRIAQQSRHAISISSADGDPDLFDRASFEQAVRRVALSGRGARVRLLLRETGRMARDGHRLLELSRRLPSLVEIRRVEAVESGQDEDLFLLDDVGGSYWQARADVLRADATLRDPHRAAELTTRFEHHWQRARPDSALRHLAI